MRKPSSSNSRLACGIDTGTQRLGLCLGSEPTPTFGGVYQMRDEICLAGNPMAGDTCTCPDGYLPEGVDSAGSNLVVCHR